MKGPALLVLLLCLAVSMPATSQASSQSADKPCCAAKHGSADLQAISALIDSAWDALGQQDLDRFMGYCRDDWVLYTAKGRKLTAKQLFTMHKANVTDFGLRRTELKVEIACNTAWATYDAEMSGQVKGNPWGGSFIFTNVFARVDGKWWCVHMHESRVDKEE